MNDLARKMADQDVTAQANLMADQASKTPDQDAKEEEKSIRRVELVFSCPICAKNFATIPYLQVRGKTQAQ